MPQEHVFVAAVRIAAFVAIVAGLIENAKTLDEFYTRVYLDACAISVVASSIIVYAAWNLHVELGARSAAVIGATFLLGFIIAFARLRST
jgi:hypothetical protein